MDEVSKRVDSAKKAVAQQAKTLRDSKHFGKNYINCCIEPSYKDRSEGLSRILDALDDSSDLKGCQTAIKAELAKRNRPTFFAKFGDDIDYKDYLCMVALEEAYVDHYRASLHSLIDSNFEIKDGDVIPSRVTRLYKTPRG